MHFRKKRQSQTEFEFCFGSIPLLFIFFLSFIRICSRALGAVLNGVKLCHDLGYKMYTQLYKSCICPIIDYGAGVWDYCSPSRCEAVQNRAIRCFLGIHKNAPKLAFNGDMGQEPCAVRHMGDMVWLWNRLIAD